MSKLICAAALAGAAWAGAVSAQEFKGMELSAEVLSFTEDGDIAQTAYRGALEFGVFGGFGIAADLSFYDFGDDDGARNVTVHALYDAFEFATVGAFYAQDSYDEGSTDAFGVEAGRRFGYADVQGYAGVIDDSGVDFRIFGVDGAYDFTDAISVTGAASYVDADGGSASRLAIGGEYRFGRGPAVYGEIGRINVSDDTGTLDGSDTYLSLGARIAVGPNEGTTFQSRSFSEALPGF